MARGKYITELEREAIRIGVHAGLKAPGIAHYLQRSRVTVHNEIAAMEASGTLQNLPFQYVVERISADMLAVEKVRKGK